MAPPALSPAKPPRPQDNALLARLGPDDLDRLAPYLRPVALPRRAVLAEPNRPVGAVHFLTSGLCSVLSYTGRDEMMEINLAGREGMANLNAALGLETSPHRVFMQVAGAGFTIAAGELRDVMAASAPVREVIERYAALVLSQIGQLSACNGRHPMPARLARWILMTYDRIDDERLPLTHEFLSLMLGVRRAGVTVALGGLEKAGVIAQHRGGIAVLDRAGLEAAACACYGVTRMLYLRGFPGEGAQGRAR